MADTVTRAGWQCPECRTVYSPDVSACHCAAVAPSFTPVPYVPLSPDLTRPVAPFCTCLQSWGGTIPPPPCPVHGRIGMPQVMC